MKSRLTLIQTVVVCFVLCSLALGQDLASFEKRTTVKKLSNGLTIVICERPEAPVFSFFTHVDAGSVQDPMGKTGLAHMFEHMAFKGKDTTSSAAYNNEFGKIVEGEGGEGMNASTGWDETQYFYSFPINRLELWAYLESERFLHPAMRQFYKERHVGSGDPRQ